MGGIQASRDLKGQGSPYIQVTWHRSPFWPYISQLCSGVRAMLWYVGVQAGISTAACAAMGL